MPPIGPADRLFEKCISLVRVNGTSETLWHYTSAEALLRILDSSSVHLTCHRFMNDPSEGELARGLVEYCWKAAVERTVHHPRLDIDWLRHHFRAAPKVTYPEGQQQAIFVFSMSTGSDLLSQWARYANDGAGVALGFTVDTGALTLAKPKSAWSYGPYLSRVHYCDVGHDQSATDAVSISLRDSLAEELVDVFEQFLLEASDPTEIFNGLLLVSEGLAPSVKSRGYAEELELRLSVETDVSSKELYHLKATRHGIAPVVKLPLDGAGIRLNSIKIGPRLGDETLWSLEWLKKKYGLEKLTVERSRLSYR